MVKRPDILNTLPRGASAEIADRLGVSRGYVSSVINGKKSQSNSKGREIIDLAQAMAAIQLWNELFCQCDAPTLDPLKVKL